MLGPEAAGQGRDRGEVPVVLVVRAPVAGEGVRDRVQDEGEDGAGPRRHVERRAVHEGVAEDEHRPGRSLGRDEAALLDEGRDRVLVHHPQGVAGRLHVEGCGGGAPAVGAADEDEGAVELVHLVEEDVEVEGEGFRHPVRAVVGGEVVVPLPHVPGESGLGVHLDLLDVELLAEELARRRDEPGVAHHPRVDLASKVQAHRGSYRVARLLAEVLGAPLGEEPRQLRLECLHLARREPPRQNQEALFPEPLDLGIMKLHRPSPVLRTLVELRGRAERPPDVTG